MTEEETAIVPGIVAPLVTPEQAEKQWAIFEALKERILRPDDYQVIKGKRYIKRSGFRKIAVYFGISDRIIKEERVDRSDESFVWRIVVEAIAPNGRTSIGVGACDSKERDFAHEEHDVYAIAHTRSKSRAISDMIAGGVVSAEEMDAPSQERPVPPPQATPEGEPDPISSLPWLESSASWLPPGTLYIFGDTEGAEELADTMRRTPDFRAVINGRLYRFSFGKGDKGSETFINAIPVGEGPS